MTKRTTIVAFLIALGFIFPQNVMGIGQMTKPIEIKSILRGQTTESTLVLYNTEEKEVKYKLAASGAISSWTSFYTIVDSDNSIDEIQISAKSNIKAIARFTVPQDAANGTYKGEVMIIEEPEKTEGGKVNVLVGSRIGRSVSITVTDHEIIKINATIIPNKHELAKNETLKIRVIYDNQSNVSVSPQIQFKIKKYDQVVFNIIYPFPESESPIKPLERKELPAIEISTASFEEGVYLADINISQEGKEVLKRDFKFSVGIFEESGANLIGIVKGVSGNTDPKINWFTIAIAAIALFVLFLKIKQLRAGNVKEEQINQ